MTTTSNSHFPLHLEEPTISKLPTTKDSKPSGMTCSDNSKSSTTSHDIEDTTLRVPLIVIIDDLERVVHDEPTQAKQNRQQQHQHQQQNHSNKINPRSSYQLDRLCESLTANYEDTPRTPAGEVTRTDDCTVSAQHSADIDEGGAPRGGTQTEPLLQRLVGSAATAAEHRKKSSRSIRQQQHQYSSLRAAATNQRNEQLSQLSELSRTEDKMMHFHHRRSHSHPDQLNLAMETEESTDYLLGNVNAGMAYTQHAHSNGHLQRKYSLPHDNHSAWHPQAHHCDLPFTSDSHQLNREMEADEFITKDTEDDLSFMYAAADEPDGVAEESLWSNRPSEFKLRDQFYSFFQASDNKLAMKLFGSRNALLKEKRRQMAAKTWIIHPCSNFR